MKWKETGMGNHILEKKGADFFISYNPSTGDGPVRGVFTEIANIMGEDLKDGEETAIVKGRTYLILEGDFRKEYEAVYPDYDKCYEIFDNNQDKRSNWSTRKEDGEWE